MEKLKNKLLYLSEQGKHTVNPKKELEEYITFIPAHLKRKNTTHVIKVLEELFPDTMNHSFTTKVGDIIMIHSLNHMIVICKVKKETVTGILISSDESKSVSNTIVNSRFLIKKSYFTPFLASIPKTNIKRKDLIGVWEGKKKDLLLLFKEVQSII